MWRILGVIKLDGWCENSVQKTAPPMMNILSSSRRTHWTTRLAAWASAARGVLPGAMAYSSKTGVLQARLMFVSVVLWWILGCTGFVCSAALRVAYNDIKLCSKVLAGVGLS